MLGTETIAVILFNAGHSLEDVMITIRGTGAAGGEVFAKEQETPAIPRGKELLVAEIPSYEVYAPVDDIAVKFVSGRSVSE